MNRLSAIDDPVELSQLIDPEHLEEVARSFADQHRIGITIADHADRAIARAGPAAGEALPGARFRSHTLIYDGEPMARIRVGPYRDVDGDDCPGFTDDEAARLAEHVSRVTGVLVHSAYARYLTATVHVAAMDETFAELSDKNKRLATAVERLKEVDRLKSSFLATISHELRTPLTSVIGYSEMLLEGLAGEISSEQRDYIETILSKADQLLQLITGILDVSLIESRSLKVERKPVSVLEIIDAAATSLATEAERRGIVLTLPDAPVPRALGDRRKLRQVVLHLLANAIKFSPDGGDVIVEVGVGPLSPDDTSTFGSPFWLDQLSRRFGIRISVRDTGIGISPEKQVRIFEPFFQVDSSSTREFGGTGLGLSLAKSYVEAHGGYIWVASELGVGSTFTLSLPCVSEELEAFAAGQASPRSGE